MRSPYCIPIRCALCGGEGNASVRDARYLLSSEFFHTDPLICRDIIKAREERKQAAAQREAA